MVEKEQNAAESVDTEKEKAEEELPYCTTAPSAEHHRADDADEPCDDGRTGNVD